MLGQRYLSPRLSGYAAADSWDGNSSFGGNSDRGSDGIGGSVMGASRRGMFAVLRIEDLGVIGEKGTKVRMSTACHVKSGVHAC